jgi:hypothetical protein
MYSRILVTVSLAVCASVGWWACSSNDPAPPPASTKSFSNFQNASVVIGQPDFVTNSSGVTSTKLNDPYGNPGFGSLYIPDYNNARVLGYLAIPTTNGAAADFVLGQPDFVTRTSVNSAIGMDGPQTSIVYNGKLLVLDWGYNRILIWNTKPTTTQAPADIVVGQPNMTTVTAGCTAGKLDSPESMAIVNGNLIVADSNNNRILVYDGIPTSNGAEAIIVGGQPDFTTCNSPGGATESNLNHPSDVKLIGNKFAVADAANHRVLIWNAVPTCTPTAPATNCAIATAPDVVLGQPDFNSSTANNGGLSGHRFDYPYFLATDGTRLAAADSNNHRVLIWNAVPTCTPVAPATNCAATTDANIVLGQPDLTSNTNNNDGTGTTGASPDARGLDYPAGVVFTSVNQLIVTDKNNNRYLIYNAQ